MKRGRGVKASLTCPRSVSQRPAAEDYSRVGPAAPEELPLVPTDSCFPPAIEGGCTPTTHSPSPLAAGPFEAAPRRSACVVLTASGTQAAGRNIQPACEVSEGGEGGEEAGRGGGGGARTRAGVYLVGLFCRV